MPDESEKYKWFIAHIAYHSDLKVKNLLDMAGIDYYMPYHTIRRIWNGVSKEYLIPTLNFCIFVRVEESDFIMLHLMQEVSLLMNNHQKPVCITDEQMKEVIEHLERSDHKGEILLQLIDEVAR